MLYVALNLAKSLANSGETLVYDSDDLLFVTKNGIVPNQMVVMIYQPTDGFLEVTYAHDGCSNELLGKIIKSLGTTDGTILNIGALPDWDLDPHVPVED